MEIKRIFDLLENYKLQFPDKPDVIAGKDNGVWIKFSINQYIEKANNVVNSLRQLVGMQAAEINPAPVRLFNNNPEKIFVPVTELSSNIPGLFTVVAPETVIL